MNAKNYLYILPIVFIFLASVWDCGRRTQQSEQKEGYLKGNISISGAFALYPMTVKWAEEFNKVYPDVRIDISAGGAGKGMMDALSGMVDLGMFSREITQPELDKGAWYIAVTKDAVLPTVSSKNPVLDELKKKGFTLETFREIFLQNKTYTWGAFLGITEQSKINVYTRSDACGAAEMWGKYLGSNQESLHGIGVFGDPGIADAVKNDRLGLGYNNVVYAYDMKTRTKYPGLEILPIDLNGNGQIDPEEDFYDSLDDIMEAIQSGRYPSPPARELYFVSKGKPVNQAVLVFLEWILEEGQQFVHEAGYVELPEDKIAAELLKLN
ncbi:MAG: substrate-binding domain-containing protein [Bacteroidales bacterium]|nr:substrate-binding domain-containing protein [Bacteroidales bacterium]